MLSELEKRILLDMITNIELDVEGDPFIDLPRATNSPPYPQELYDLAFEIYEKMKSHNIEPCHEE